MSPTYPIFYPANGALPNAVLSGYFLLLARVSNDLARLGLSDFCGSASFASIGGSMPRPVHLIGRGRIPAQVSKGVVRWVAIVVARLLTLLWWSNKSEKNKPMDAHHFRLVVSPKQDERAPRLINSGLLKRFLRDRKNAPLIRYMIQRFVSDYRAPAFLNHRHIPITVDMGIVAQMARNYAH